MIAFAKKTFYVTTTIPYANAPPHIGFALEIIQADVLARFNKQLGRDVFFLTGTDEYGVKNYQEAKKLKLTPKQFVNKNSAYFKKLTKILNISNDYFIRTTDKKVHWPGVIKMWNSLKKKGDIYKKKYEGYYCSGCERFVTEKDLVSGKCPNHPNRKLEYVAEENYFFKLSKYSNKIKNLIKGDELRIHPIKRKNDFLALIKDGLQDVSFSRSKKHLPWGVPVPGDPSQVMYVWCDALTNYLTGIGYPKAKYKKYWYKKSRYTKSGKRITWIGWNKAHIVHVVGKDMLRFHAGIWPGMLLSAGLPLPKILGVHGFLTVNGQKISKSLGNVISPEYLVKKYGVDTIRYFLLSEIPAGEDGDFSETALVQRHNSELANSLGNLVSRSLTLIEKAGGKIPKGKIDSQHKDKLEGQITNFIQNFIQLEFHHALRDILVISNIVNRYIDKKKPWTKKGKELENILYNLAESLRFISALTWPFIPETSEKIAKQLGIKVPKFDEIIVGQIKQPGNRYKIRYGRIKPGIKVKKGEILFKKVEYKEVSKLEVKKMIKFSDFEKLDLRVGKIVQAEDVPKSEKLIKMQVDFGAEKRQVVAGIKQWYKAKDIIGKSAAFVVNLEPREIMGLKSEAMILAAQDGGKVAFISPDKNVKPGSEIT